VLASANVDVSYIYKKADQYAEVYGLQVSVRYSTSRGYFFLSVFAESVQICPKFLHFPSAEDRQNVAPLKKSTA
jgi:hypothetical protein